MKLKRFALLFMALMLASVVVASSEHAFAQEAKARETNGKRAKDNDSGQQGRKTNQGKWTDLKGKWSECQFGGDGEIEITDKLITLGYGDPITGIKWDGDIPRDNYEIEIEARRVEGFDFFCAITFPIAKSHASLVLGGWGGGVVGISSIDDRDASDNETTMFKNFDNDVWYRARIRIEQTRLAVWLDDTLLFEQPRKDHTFDIRYEMDPCLPFGVANYQCKSEIRVVRVRKLRDKELGIDLSKAGKKADAKK